jgi:hypothetical protein
MAKKSPHIKDNFHNFEKTCMKIIALKHQETDGGICVAKLSLIK